MQLQLFEYNIANNKLSLQIDSLKEQNSETDVANNELRLQIDSLRGQNSETNVANNELCLQIVSLQEQSSESKVENNELRSEIDSLREQSAETNLENNELRSQIVSLKEQNSESNDENKELRTQIDSLQEQSTETGNRLKYFEQIEKDIMGALLSAQRIATQVKEEATKQADELLQSARSESETLLSETTRTIKLKVNDAQTLLIHKQSQINLIEEQLQGLSKQKTELQARVDQVINFMELAVGMLGPSKISSAQNSE